MKLLLGDLTKQQLESLAARRPAAYIFEGPAKVGKFTAALQLACNLNCPKGSWDDACSNCQQIMNEAYPDLFVIRPEKASIGIGQIHELKSHLQLAPYYKSGWRFAIIDHADKLTEEAQSSLLKILEESPPQTSFILICTEPGSLLATIQSRCEKLIFTPVKNKQLVAFLMKNYYLEAPAAETLVDLSDGRVGRAAELAGSPETQANLQSLLKLTDQVIDGSTLSKLLLVSSIAGLESEIEAFLQLLAKRIKTKLLAGSEFAGYQRSLDAIQECLRNLRAGVGSKPSLEALMLKLG